MNKERSFFHLLEIIISITGIEWTRKRLKLSNDLSKREVIKKALENGYSLNEYSLTNKETDE